MNEHEIESEQDLPELQDAILDEAKLDALFADLAACAEVHAVRLKAGSRTGAADTTVSLDEAHAQLTSGDTQGAQIRYTYQGKAYTDTLLRTADGFRLIRM